MQRILVTSRKIGNYVARSLVGYGFSGRGDSLQSLAQTGKDSKLGQDGNFLVSPDYHHASIKPEHRADLLAAMQSAP